MWLTNYSIFYKFCFLWCPLGVTPIGFPPEKKVLDLETPYLMTSCDQKLDFWLKSFSDVIFLWCPLGVHMEPKQSIFELTILFTIPTCVPNLVSIGQKLHTQTHTHTHTYIQKILPTARSVEKYDSQPSGTFSLEMAANNSWFSRI